MEQDKNRAVATAICTICPHNCHIRQGATGICGVRINQGNGEVTLASYGSVSGYGTDPIEKKPLYHFYPGTVILSVGSYGCNLRCDFCQNCSISQEFDISSGRLMTPESIVADALRIPGNTGIAFTYNEPVVWFEFLRDTALKAREEGLKTVMVSNGYASSATISEAITFIDAFNIDLKFFSDKSYKRFTGGTMAPVLRSICDIAQAGRHLEITTLVIPTLNDTPGEIGKMASWIVSETGRETPLHLSRYFPAYRRTTPGTAPEALAELHAVASGHLSYVYAGNAPSLQLSDTICPECGTITAERRGYTTKLMNLTPEGRCKRCNREVFRYLTSPL
jgi:pyruvate formate lyase activating enzyme